MESGSTSSPFLAQIPTSITEKYSGLTIDVAATEARKYRAVMAQHLRLRFVGYAAVLL